MVQRKFFKDRWNPEKVWEVVKMDGGYYLRQYIKGNQIGRGIKTRKKHISSIGILDFQEVAGAK